MKNSKKILRNRYMIFAGMCIFILVLSYVITPKGTFSVTDEEVSIIPGDAETVTVGTDTVATINGERCVRSTGDWVYIASCKNGETCTSMDNHEYAKNTLTYSVGCTYNGPSMGSNDPKRGYRCNTETGKWVYIYYCDSNMNCLANTGDATTKTISATKLHYGGSGYCTEAMPSQTPISYNVTIDANGGTKTVTTVYYINSISVSKLSSIVSNGEKTLIGWKIGTTSVGSTLTSADNGKTLVAQWSGSDDDSSVIPNDNEEVVGKDTVVKISGERCVKDENKWIYIDSCKNGEICTTMDGEQYLTSVLRYTGGCTYNGPAVGNNNPIRGYRCNKETGKWAYIYYCDANKNCLANTGDARTTTISATKLRYSGTGYCNEAMPSQTPVSYSVKIDANGGARAVSVVYYINSMSVSKLSSIVSNGEKTLIGWKIGTTSVGKTLSSADNGKTLVAQWSSDDDDETAIPNDAETEIVNNDTVVKISGERCVKGENKWIYIDSCKNDEICTTMDGEQYLTSVLRYTGGCTYNGPAVGNNNPIRGYRCNKETGKWVYVYYCDVNGNCLVNTGDAKTATNSSSILRYGGAHCSDPMPTKMPISYNVTIDANGGTKTVTTVYYINSISVSKLSSIVSNSGKKLTGWKIGTKTVGSTLGATDNGKTLVAQWSSSGNSNNSGSGNTNQNITVNPPTGTLIMIVSFAVAIVAFWVAFYCFRKNRLNNN